jgi:hypothetical protein
VIYLCNQKQQNAHIYVNVFIIIISSACVDHPSVQPQEILYTQIYGISFVCPCKQSDRCQVVLGTKVLDLSFKTLDVRNLLKTLQLN